MFCGRSAVGEPTKNTYSESTGWGEKWRVIMKFSFDITDIDNIAENWLAILIDEVETSKSIDINDVRYIVDLMYANPKMKRLVPCIIKELFGYYEDPLIEEF